MAERLPDDLFRALAARPDIATRWPTSYVSETTSTNDVVMALAHAGAPPGTVVVAGTQTAGRGRRGHVWSSPLNGGLYLSALLPAYDDRAGAPSPWLTLMAGVAAAAAVRRVAGVEACVKWPNDLVVHVAGSPSGHWRKLGGILSEGVPRGSRIASVVVGLGLNLRSVSHAPDVAMLATSLERESGRTIDRGELLVAILEGLARGGEALRGGREADIRDQFLAWSPLSRGGCVRWIEAGAEREGVAVDVDAGAALVVQVAGRLERLVGGDLRWERHGTLP